MGKSAQGIAQSAQRYRAVPRVLCFVEHGDDVLLLKGAPDKRIWAGLYNGVGGHVEHDEDVHSAAAREIREETGLSVDNLRLRGVVNIDAGGEAGIVMFVFTARALECNVIPSGEGELVWTPKGRLPTTGMVEDLNVLLPRLFSMRAEDEPFFAHYAYDECDQLVITFAQ